MMIMVIIMMILYFISSDVFSAFLKLKQITCSDTLQDDTWYSKEKLYKDHVEEVLLKLQQYLHVEEVKCNKKFNQMQQSTI